MAFVSRPTLALCKLFPTFERVKKDGVRFLRVGIIDKDESFPACFSQVKESEKNSEIGNEKPETTRVLR